MQVNKGFESLKGFFQILSRLFLAEIKTANQRGETENFIFIGDGASRYVYKFKHANFVVKITDKAFCKKEYFSSNIDEFDYYPEIKNKKLFAATYAYIEVSESVNFVISEFIEGVKLFSILETYKPDIVYDLQNTLNSGEVVPFYLHDIHANNVIVNNKGKFRIVDYAT